MSGRGSGGRPLLLLARYGPDVLVEADVVFLDRDRFQAAAEPHASLEDGLVGHVLDRGEEVPKITQGHAAVGGQSSDGALHAPIIPPRPRPVGSLHGRHSLRQLPERDLPAWDDRRAAPLHHGPGPAGGRGPGGLRPRPSATWPGARAAAPPPARTGAPSTA